MGVWLIWKWLAPLLAPVLGIALVGALIWVALDAWKIAELTADRDQLKAAIYDPSTGFVARNAQCETNVAGLTVNLDGARADIKALADKSDAQDAKSTQTMAAAVKTILRGVSTSTARLLARPSTTVPGTLDSCKAGEAYIRGVVP